MFPPHVPFLRILSQYCEAAKRLLAYKKSGGGGGGGKELFSLEPFQREHHLQRKEQNHPYFFQSNRRIVGEFRRNDQGFHKFGR